MEVQKECPIDARVNDQEIGACNNLKPRGRIQCFLKGIGPTYMREVLAEMVGTFIMMFSVCGIIASTVLTKGEVGLLEYASTAGFAIILVIFTVGPISGAHVNPSVTIAFATIGQFPWSKVPVYVSAHMLGSVFAAGLGKYVYGMEADFAVTRPLHGWQPAFWSEIIATFFIMFLASALSSNPRNVGHLSSFAVGAAISLAVLITGPVSGGSLNPARSFGPAVISWKFDYIWLYLAAPTIGAIAGALLFQLVKLQQRPCPSTSSSLTDNP